MIAKEMLDTLKEMFDEDASLDDEVHLLDVLDYMAIIGIPGASECYFKMLKEEGIQVNPVLAETVGHA